VPQTKLKNPFSLLGNDSTGLENREFSKAGTQQQLPGPKFKSSYQSVIDPQLLDPPLLPADNRNDIPYAVPQDDGTNISEQQTPLGSPENPSEFHVQQTPQQRGYRYEAPINRGTPWDHGQVFAFENKKQQFPPMKEIIATGRFFGMAELWLMKPYFNGNAVMSSQGPVFSQAFQADHAWESAPRFRAGFESMYGPGAELQYFQFDHNSSPVQFLSDGVTQGLASVDALGLNSPVGISTSAAGDRLGVEQSLEVHSLLFSVFKEAKLPVARINGMMGLRYTSIAQHLRADVVDNSGTTRDFLRSNTDFRGYGPYFGIEYYRPIGHTKLELVSSAAGSLLLGNRDHFINRSDTLVFQRRGSDEVVTVFDVMAGVQYKYEYAEKRSYYARLAYLNQVWMNGGSVKSPIDDFGFRGVALSIGFNR
jgi:hypothetical protein